MSEDCCEEEEKDPRGEFWKGSPEMTAASEKNSGKVKGTAIIVAYNSGRCVDACLRALIAQPGWDVILVDNASKDDTVSRAQAFAPKVHVIANKQNAGVSRAVNQAVRAARGDVFVLVNPDAVAQPGALDNMAEALAFYKAGAVGGVLLLEGDRLQIGNLVRRFPTLGSALAELFLLNKIWPRNWWNRSYRCLDMNYSRPQPVDNPAGACLGFLREVWQKVGGFDESYYPCWFEDADFCRCVRDAGYTIVYQPTAIFRHESAHSVSQLSFYKRKLLWYSNHVHYFRKHHGRLQTAILRIGITLSLLIRAALSLVAHPKTGRNDAASAYVRVAWKCGILAVAPRSMAEPSLRRELLPLGERSAAQQGILGKNT